MSIDLAPKVREGRSVAILIPLLILHLVLLSIQIQDTGGTLLFRKWLLMAETPIWNATSGFTGGVRNLWLNYFWLRGAREENLQLRETVRQFMARESELKRLAEENSRLRQMYALKEAVPYETIGARVVGRTPSYLANVAYLDRGSADGVRLDSPVIAGRGIFGRVILVTPHSSQVQLITNPDASTGALLDRTRAPGVVKGKGDPYLELDYISNTENVEAGDIVSTSGLDGIFPKELLVGSVIETQKGQSGFRLVRVEPAADLMRTEEVSILRVSSKRPAGEREDSRNQDEERTGSSSSGFEGNFPSRDSGEQQGDPPAPLEKP